MAFPQGVDFRATSGFVTDPANYTSELNTTSPDYPVTTPQNNTVGWETVPNNLDTRDRNSGIDVRCAGLAFVTVGTNTFRIDLPATGNYGIQAAFGDASNAEGTFTINFKDNTTIFATPVSAGTTSSGGFYAANGTLETSAANWATNNPNAGNGTDEITHNFTSTIFRIDVVAGSGVGSICSVFIRSLAGATGLGALLSDQQGFIAGTGGLVLA